MQLESLVECRRALDRREVSSEELTGRCLQRIEQLNPKLNCFISVCEERALEQARAADLRIAKGQVAAMTGIPIAHKDIFCVHGLKTTCGSRMLATASLARRPQERRLALTRCIRFES